ncbi:MAG: FMN-binding negative transcriptional regulator [Hyphomicrobiales bacterium]|nr:FMN-binding negative transcriptional regulator [Hyphomicrobiales bacterium]MDE2113989.1 FMN-binding negative transcriptional regulator [Hyphomicrobiales bacterium]
MYVPLHFREDRPDVLAQAIRDIQLAVLVTASAEGLQATHLPVHLALDRDGGFLLKGHVARANPHWQMAGSGESLFIFQGPQTYISPSYYPSKQDDGKVVPTWNYIAVHVHGVLEVMQEEAELMAFLHELTNANEGRRADPWAIDDAPPDYIAQRAKGIVGIKMKAARIEASWKMTQNRMQPDRLGTIAGLEQTASSQNGAQAVASVMRQLEAIRDDK